MAVVAMGTASRLFRSKLGGGNREPQACINFCAVVTHPDNVGIVRSGPNIPACSDFFREAFAEMSDSYLPPTLHLYLIQQ